MMDVVERRSELIFVKAATPVCRWSGFFSDLINTQNAMMTLPLFQPTPWRGTLN
jgi:hypothetical protein